MASIDEVKSLADLPGYDRLADVARRHKEPMALRGSALRRVIVRLLRGESIDYLLPALCSPPPSDLDLLFETKDAEKIVTLLGEMRDASPILQSVRLEVSSLPRVEKLHKQLAAHIECPVFGLALPALAEQGFADPTDRAIQEISDGSLTFQISDQAMNQPGLFDNDVLFHIYGSCLSFLKASFEHDAYTASGAGHEMAVEFLMRNLSMVEVLLDPQFSHDAEKSDYYQARLEGLAYSLRAILTAEQFDTLTPLLPESIGNPYREARTNAPLFRIAGQPLFVPDDDWSAFDGTEIVEAVDLSQSKPLARSPVLDVPDTENRVGKGLECHVPRIGPLAGSIDNDLGAILKLSLAHGSTRHDLWIPTLCQWDQNSDATNLRVPMDALLDVVHEVEEQFPGTDSEFQIYLVEPEAALW